MRKSWIVLMALAIVAVSVPAFAGDKKDNAVNEGCVKIEDDQIGVEGVSATVDGVTVTFTNWVEKADSPGEYIGFDYSFTGGTFAEFDVKQGQEYVYVTLNGTTTGTWHNGTGVSGSDVKGTSHIRFCGADDTVVTPTTIVSPPPPPPPG